MNLLIIFTSILIFTIHQPVLAFGEDMDKLLKAYGYGHKVYGDRVIQTNGNCQPGKDKWQFFKTGVWGRDDRRPLFVDESSLPPELRLTKREKHQLKAVGRIGCVNEANNSLDDGTGFIVDIDVLGANPQRNYDVIATSAHVLYDQKAGELKNCQYIVTSNGRKEYYDITPLKCGSTMPDLITKGANDKDWCFVKVEHRLSKTFGSLEVDFSDKFDWSLSEQDKSRWINGGYRPEKDRVDFSLDCSPDDKSRYSNLVNSHKWGYDYSRVVVGDCDSLPGASGGPLAERVGTQLKVHAMTDGDLHKNRRSGKYDPQKRGSVFTKFTLEMKKALEDEIFKIESI